MLTIPITLALGYVLLAWSKIMLENKIARLTPPREIVSEEDFIRWSSHPIIKRIAIEHNGDKITLLDIGTQRLFASGPTVYFFKEGKIYDWVFDYNDSKSEILGIDYSDRPFYKNQ